MEENTNRKKPLTGKRTESLFIKFGTVFAVFTIVILILGGLATYKLQEMIYEQRIEETVTHLTQYLQVLIKADGDDFVQYQAYMLEHGDEVLVPYDFDGNYLSALEEYERLFSDQYPGKTLGSDISFDELSDEVKNAFAVYTHEYWLYVFESATRVFNVDYTYYVTTDDKPNHMRYIIDAVRDPKTVDGKDYINLSAEINEVPEELPVLWSVWEAGESVAERDEVNNSYGNEYSYYEPLYINGEKMGIIGVDIPIASVNAQILKNTMILETTMALILIVGVIITLTFMEKNYIRRLETLVGHIRKYTMTKDPKIAHVIEYDSRNGDEISALSKETAKMMLELDKYLKHLSNANNELSETKRHADELQALANRDPLTGIRNKSAYEDEIRKLEWDVAGGADSFGIGIVDLNNLKEINEKYGHDNGNLAIRELCFIVCNVFKHSPVFRIGGDVFAIILKNGDYGNVHQLVDELNDTVKKKLQDESLEPWKRISAAIGIALFDPKADFTVGDVFKRAESNMYKKKREMKAAESNKPDEKDL